MGRESEQVTDLNYLTEHIPLVTADRSGTQDGTKWLLKGESGGYETMKLRVQGLTGVFSFTFTNPDVPQGGGSGY